MGKREINDEIFINIAKKNGYEIDRETIESIIYDKDELGLEGCYKGIEIPDVIIGYISNILDNPNKYFGIYLDSNNLTIEGLIGAVVINYDVEPERMFKYIDKKDLELKEE